MKNANTIEMKQREKFIKVLKEMKQFCIGQTMCKECIMEDVCRRGWNELNPHEWCFPEAEERSENE